MLQLTTKTRLLLITSLALPACGGGGGGAPNVQDGGGAPSRTSSPSRSSSCGDVVGAWSPIVSGLHARLVTAGSKPDRSALDVTLEIENVSDEAVELSWNGDVPLGFATFRLDDAQGKDIEPDWRFGGNSPSGNVRALFRTSRTIRYDVHHGAFTTMMGKRALRIGAFWGRELPTDGTKRFLRATISATNAADAANAANAANPAPNFAYEGNDLVRDPPKARAFTRTLEVPAVCIE